MIPVDYIENILRHVIRQSPPTTILIRHGPASGRWRLSHCPQTQTLQWSPNEISLLIVLPIGSKPVIFSLIKSCLINIMDVAWCFILFKYVCLIIEQIWTACFITKEATITWRIDKSAIPWLQRVNSRFAGCEAFKKSSYWFTREIKHQARVHLLVC